MEKFEVLRQLEKLPFSTLLTFTALVFIPTLSLFQYGLDFTPKTKQQIRERCHNRSELTGLQPTADDRINMHHIKPKHRGGGNDISNAIAVLESEHRLIHLIIDGFDMRKYNPKIKDCDQYQSQSVWNWLTYTKQIDPQ